MIEANGVFSSYKSDHDDDHDDDDDDDDDDLYCLDRRNIVAMIPSLPRAPV